MAKNTRKKVFPKKPERLNSKTAEKLGKNSNKVGYDASKKAIYFNHKPTIKDTLTQEQKKQLAALRRNLPKHNAEMH